MLNFLPYWNIDPASDQTLDRASPELEHLEFHKEIFFVLERRVGRDDRDLWVSVLISFDFSRGEGRITAAVIGKRLLTCFSSSQTRRNEETPGRVNYRVASQFRPCSSKHNATIDLAQINVSTQE